MQELYAREQGQRQRSQVLVFTNTTAKVKALQASLSASAVRQPKVTGGSGNGGKSGKKGSKKALFACGGMFGSMPQDERVQALSDFKSGKTQVKEERAKPICEREPLPSHATRTVHCRPRAVCAPAPPPPAPCLTRC